MNKAINAERRIENKLRAKNRVRVQDNLISQYIKPNTLSEAQKRAIDKVYGKYVGKLKYNFHEFYFQKTGYFSPYYIPEWLWNGYIEKFYNDWTTADYIDNKCYYDVLFPGFKQPETVAKRINNYWNVNGEIVNLEAVVSLIAMKSDEKYFIKKATDSMAGKGVFCINNADEQKINKIISEINCDIIIQKGIKQSNITRQLSNNSVNTVRILSFLDKTGNVKIYSRVIRMGIGDKEVDNAGCGGIMCGIESDGRLKDRAYSEYGGVTFDKIHPTKEIEFTDIVLPTFNKVEKLIMSAHLKIPNFRTISWDIAFDENDEPVLIEVNLRDAGIEIHQLNNGPLFGDDTENVLGEVFGHN